MQMGSNQENAVALSCMQISRIYEGHALKK